MNKIKIFGIIILIVMIFHTTVYAETYVVEFDDFEFKAVTDEDGSSYLHGGYRAGNNSEHPGRVGSTKYFTVDDEEIPDIEEYIRSHGAEPTDGMFYVYNHYEKFAIVRPTIGHRDTLGEADDPSNRVRIGDSDHYAVGVNALGDIGCIEAEDGTDIYYSIPDFTNVTWQDMHVIDAKEELYVIQYHSEHADDGYWRMIDSSFKTISNGYFSYQNTQYQKDAYMYLKPAEIEAGSPGITIAEVEEEAKPQAEEEKLRKAAEAERIRKNKIYATIAGAVIAILEILYFIIINKVTTLK